MFKINNEDTRTTLLAHIKAAFCSCVSIVNFEHVIAGWDYRKKVHLDMIHVVHLNKFLLNENMLNKFFCYWKLKCKFRLNKTIFYHHCLQVLDFQSRKALILSHFVLCCKFYLPSYIVVHREIFRLSFSFICNQCNSLKLLSNVLNMSTPVFY